MATIGILPEFDLSRGSFTAFVERVQFFLATNGVKEDKHAAVLLSAVGEETYALLRNLLAPSSPKDKSFGDIVQTLKNHFEPRPLIIAERFRFHRRNQRPDESVSEFVAELRRLTRDCEFGGHLDEALRDRFVCGLQNEAIQKKLLTESNLNFQGAIEITHTMETAAKNAKQLKGVETQAVAQVSKVSHSEGNKKACYRCGKEGHWERDCRHKDTVCHNCKKRGHIAKVCHSKQQNPPRQVSSRGRGRGKRAAKWVGVEECKEDSDGFIETPVLKVGGHNEKPLTATLEIEGVEVPMEVDTGAAVSLISEKTQRCLFPKVKLEKPEVRLNTYTAEAIPVVGVLTVQVKYRDYSGSHALYVVGGNGPTLLGRDWLQHVRLDWHSLGVAYVGKPSQTLNDVVREHSEVFQSELGLMTDFKAKLAVKPGAKPIFMRPRAVPYALQEPIERELDRLELTGVIKKVLHSEWAAPIVAVPKSDGTVHICGDYKVMVNQSLDVDSYPLPKPEDLMVSLTGGKKFTKLDLSSAYQQMPLEEESQSFVTVNTHRGLYQYSRLPFGVASAPVIFQKPMDTILQGLPHAICYLDDILVTGTSDQEHLQNLKAVLARLGKNGLRLKQSKCSFMQTSVTYLGHKIDASGIHASDDKVNTIQKAPTPTNVSELRSFLGLFNYYGKFVRNLSTLLHPLNQLLREDQPWKWTAICEEAFLKAKEQLSIAPVLVHYDPNLPIRLAGDASNYGIGAVLSHVLPDGSEHPIAFTSRTLQSSEQNYAQVEKEALSLVFGIQKFHKYIYGRRFTLITDHKPLTTILGPKTGVPALAVARLQRWALLLSAYSYNIEFRPTKSHANADGLSRLPLSQPAVEDPQPSVSSVFSVSQIQALPVSAPKLQRATRTDPKLSRVYKYTLSGWPEQVPEDLKPFWHRRWELTVEAGCVIWGIRVLVPKKLCKQVLEMFHEGHLGIVRMKALARSYLWWLGLDGELEKLAKACVQCQKEQNSPAVAPLHPWLWPARPWARVHLDFAGPFQGRNFLIAVDAHSKWPEVVEMMTTTATQTVTVLRRMFAANGLPEHLVSDNGPQFTSEEFASFCRFNGIKHIRVSPYHPSSNGLAERFVQTFKVAMRKSEKDGLSFSHRLSSFLLLYRATPQGTTAVPPSMLFLGRCLRTRLDLLRPDLGSKVASHQASQKEHHDAHSRPRYLQVGNSVMVRDFHGSSRWVPAKIVEQLGPVSFMVQTESGIVWKRHTDHIRAQVDTSPSEPDPAGEEEFLSLSRNTTAESVTTSVNQDSSLATESESSTARRYPSRVRQPPDRFTFDST